MPNDTANERPVFIEIEDVDCGIRLKTYGYDEIID